MYRTHPVVRKAVGPLHAAIPDDLVGIHGILYDPGELDHPGGRVWIDLVRGTDCTELFEMSHLDIGRARLLLARLPVRGAYPVARRTMWTQYERLREAARCHLPTRAARRGRRATTTGERKRTCVGKWPRGRLQCIYSASRDRPTPSPPGAPRRA